MNNQQVGLSSTPGAKRGNSTLALLFFAMGALHLYAMMRSRPSRTILGQKATLVSRPEISSLQVKVSIVAAAMALLVTTLMF